MPATPATQTISKTSKTTPGWSNPCIAPKLASGPATIRLTHLVGPTCWWSWGYQGVITRVRLVYGDQVDIRLPVAPVWQDLDQWLGHNGMDRKGWEAWAKESAAIMGLAIHTNYSKGAQPTDSTPAALAVLAANRQGAPKGERFARAVIRRACVEGRDVTTETELGEAAQESGLDIAAFRRDLADRKGLQRDLEQHGEGLSHGAVGFYNLLVEDDKGRRVTLDNAFDPKAVEEAIDYLSGGRLRKNAPTDPVEYLRAAGPTPAVEIARAFGWPMDKTQAALSALEKRGAATALTLAGALHWTAA